MSFGQVISSARSPDAAAAFFERALEAFEGAAEQRGCVDRHFSVAGCALRVRFAGPALVDRLVPALQHLALQTTTCPFTICAWDDASTGVRMPPPPWHWGAHPGRGEVPGFDNERIRVAFHQDPGIFCMLNPERRIALYRVRDAGEVPYYESAAPFRTILHWWLGPQQRQLAHAAAVGTPEGGVLLVGKGGVGKSTTAIACAAAGLGYVADDFCLVASSPQPYVWGLYNTGKLDATSVRLIPDLPALAIQAKPRDGEKTVLHLQDHWPGRVVPGFPVRAVVVPLVTGETNTTIVPTTPAAVFTALAPSTIFLLAGAGKPALRVMSELIDRVPCYRLNVGTVMRQVPNTLRTVLT